MARIRERICFVLLMAVLTVTAGGCAFPSFVEVRKTPFNPLAERLKLTATGGPRASDATIEFLRSTGYRGDKRLEPMLRHTVCALDGPHHQRALAAASELSYIGGRNLETKDRALALELFVDAAEYAWDYLTQSHPDGVIDPRDSRHSVVGDLYNASVEQVLRLTRTESRALPGPIPMQLSQRIITIDVPYSSSGWRPEHYGAFEFVNDYEVRHLRNRHQRSGLGVPLIMTRRRGSDPPALEKYYANGISFPVTAVLRFDHDAPDELGRRTLRLQIMDPAESDGFVVRSSLMPLQADFSTPMAWFLADPSLKYLDTWGLVRPDRAESVAGLYMTQPYDPDRIPVVMIHGLWSSPLTWMEMFNELQADRQLRERYQLWFYLYPSGDPLPMTSAGLRDRLRDLYATLDPQRGNPNLNDMVLIGHSMGGLMSHLMTQDSGTELWNTVSRKPVEQIRASPDVHNEIRRVFFFQSTPSVTRIVTIAAPYGGSRLSNPFTRWLGGSFISLPSRSERISQLIAEQNETGWRQFIPMLYTSVDSLSKKSPVLRFIRQTSVPPNVAHHNIVGIDRGHGASSWSDGIVRFISAHRDGVDSEIAVNAGHSEIQSHPDTIKEVQRILHLHLERHRYRSGVPVIPTRTLPMPVHASRPTAAARRG